MNEVLAIVAGALVVLSMGLNSALGQKIGVFRSAAVNYGVGLAGALGLALVGGFGAPTTGAPVPWWAWTGGLLGVGIVAGSNTVLPRIPVVAAAVLIVAGQLGTGLVLDALRTGLIDPWALAGAALVAAGLVVSQSRPT